MKPNPILPSEALQPDRLPQDRQELHKLLALLLVAEDVLLGDLQRGGGRQTGPRPVSWSPTCLLVSYLSLPLTQNAKLKIRGHSVFIKGGYEFWSLWGGGRERQRCEKTRPK